MILKIIVLFLVNTVYCQFELSARSRNFSIELLHFTALQTDNHVVISPFGIWTLMTGVALGARENSYNQVRRAFRLPKNDRTLIKSYKALVNDVLAPGSHDVLLTSKNYVFLDDDFTINPEFHDTITAEFGAVIKVLDFKNPTGAAKLANNYIANSGGKSANVLTSDDFAESRMILTNVISFKGLWGLPFNKTDTAIENFMDENGNPIGQVNMMYQRGQFPYSNVKELQAFVVELPYGNDQKYSMLVLLPHMNVKLKDMYRNFGNVKFSDIYKKLDEDLEIFDGEEVDVRIPRFKISTNLVLNKPLNDMGVFDIFEPKRADFTGVTNEPIFVSAIVHKADIEVTESGTVASGSTSAIFADRITPPNFYANRPFVYFVMERSTTTVIFGGIYSKPTVY